VWKEQVGLEYSKIDLSKWDLETLRNQITLKIDDKHEEILIYHNGKLDSENPYKYEMERKNVW
jgi:hypothetical protein